MPPPLPKAMRFPLALAGILLLAGCVSPAAIDPQSVASVDTAAVTATLRELLADVPCEATSVDAGSTSDNLLDLASLQYDGSAHGETDARGDWLLVARYQAGGFEVVSIADPLAPTLAATYQAEEENAQDVKWMPDGRSAVVGVNLKVVLVDVGPVLDSPLSPAETLEANVSPVKIAEWEYPLSGTNPMETSANMHMLTTAEIAGEQYVFVAPNTNTGFWVLKRDGDALVTVGNFGAPLGGGPLGPHDMSLVWDEMLDAPILYVANGFEGWLAFDVSDPAAPRQLAMMLNLDAAPVSYTHTVLGAQVGERRLVVTIAEVGVNMMKVYDATDLEAPVLVGVWWAEKTAPQLPQHNLQIVGDKLFMAHYTQGVFVFNMSAFDASAPLLGTASITPMAHYAPTTPEAPDTLGFGNVWDVVVHRGLVYVNDMAHGTSVVGFGCFAPGDAAATSSN